MTETETKDKATEASKTTEAKKKATSKLPTLREKVEQIAEMHPEIIGGRIYGPFTDYVIVTTDYGDYGLSRHLVLGFANEQQLNKETFQMEDVPRARYYRLSDGERVRGNGVHPDAGGEGEEDYGEVHGHGDTVPPPGWSGQGGS
jgi:hypothetical protein